MKEVKGQYNPKELEQRIREYWESNKIPNKLTKFDFKKKKFYLLDGPPYANADPHVGHVKSTTFKDIWSKFKLLQGFSSWFQPGFDMHGLPIENMVEKKLGIKSKQDIEMMGVDKFIEECRRFATGNEQNWLSMYKQLGAWRGYLEPYITFENYYIESGWWTVKQLFDKGMLVMGDKSIHWCPHCVDKDSTVLTSEGISKKISELENCWTHHDVIGFDEKNTKLSTSPITKYYKYPSEQVALLSTLETGRSIIASLDHPFWVNGKKWVPLKDIKVGDKVAVSPHVESVEERKEIKVASELDIIKIVTLFETKRGKKNLSDKLTRFKDLVTLDKQLIELQIGKLRKRGLSAEKIQNYLLKNKKVEISLGSIFNINKPKNKNRTLEYVIRELKSKNLLPLTTKDERILILARLLGHIFGDGFLYYHGKKRVNLVAGFTGTEEDLKKISEDLNKLGFPSEDIKRTFAKSVLKDRVIKGYTFSFRTNSWPFIILMMGLGAPIGNKADKNFEVPKWIINGPKHVIREFLAAYFGSELDKIKTIKDRKTFDSLTFSISKNEKILDSGVKFVKQISNLLLKFGVRVTNVRKNKVYERKDGSKTRALDVVFSASHENLLNFCKYIGYRYCKERELLAVYCLEYLMTLKQLETKELSLREKIKELKKNGLSLKDISIKLGLKPKYVDYILYGHIKGVRVGSKFSSFKEWLKEAVINYKEGLIWETIDKIKLLDKRDVRDIQVSNLHSFVVNGFLTHNCETALSGYEVSDSYADVKDPSLYVKFPLVGKENEYIVVWTTTPWTLISNVAIAVHPNEYYLRVKVGNETLIIAEKRAEPVLKELLNLKYEITEKMLGKKLEGIKYRPLFDVPAQKKLDSNPNARRIILSTPVLIKKSYKHKLSEGKETKEENVEEFVTMDEGSGTVHTAPGHGPTDHLIGLHYNLPIVSPLDEQGRYTEEGGEFKGIFVKDADKMIAEKLEKKNLLLHFGWVTHSYPLCWRCKSPLVFRVSKQWFFKVDEIKEKMIKENQKVRWLPDFGKERFHNWLEDAVDWCISQQRYWGIPLPVWTCQKCEDIDVIGSLEELKERSLKKLPKEIDLHKHVVDKIEIKCNNCKSSMKRVPDTMNVWFDSGIAPWASLGYPHQNKELFEKLWPVDLVDESQDQIRGWFYSLMFCGVAAFGKSPYKSVALNGWVTDEKGEKMSKSLGNVVWAENALDKLGADILRLYYCWETPAWEVQNFSFKTAEEIRKALNILWNSYSFFTTYVAPDFKPSFRNLKTEDKWIQSRLHSLIQDVTAGLENFEFHNSGRKIVDFVINELSRLYIKLIRDRVWVSESGKEKQAALSVLYQCLLTVSKLLAPITPFLSEEIYRNLDGKEKSVFITEWSKANPKLIDKELEEQMGLVKEITEAALAARQQAGIKLRWPISEVLVQTENKNVVETLDKLDSVLLFLCNTKSIGVTKESLGDEFSEVQFKHGKVYISKTLDQDLLEEAMVKELTREVQNLRKKNNFNVKDNISLFIKSDKETERTLAKYFNLIKKEVGAVKVMSGLIKGDYKGKLSFEDKTIEIGFDRV